LVSKARGGVGSAEAHIWCAEHFATRRKPVGRTFCDAIMVANSQWRWCQIDSESLAVDTSREKSRRGHCGGQTPIWVQGLMFRK
jgi:hypothetical protein